MPHNTPHGLPNRLPHLTSSPPGHVPPIVLPLNRKGRGAISEAYWIYGTVITIIEKDGVLSLKRIGFTGP